MAVNESGELRCDGCGKKLGEAIEGKAVVAIVCPRSRCKRYNVFNTEKDKKPLTQRA